MPRRFDFATLKCAATAMAGQKKKAPCNARRLCRFKSAQQRSGLYRRERIAVAVFRQGADVRETKVVAADHALFGNDPIEERAARGLRLRAVGIEHREPARVLDEQ